MSRVGVSQFIGLVLLLPAAWVQAAISCTVTSPGFSTDYDASLGSASWAIQTYFTVACTRGNGGDPTSISYSVEASNGLHAAAGGGNRAALGTNLINYDTYGNSGCSSAWNRTNSQRLPSPPPGTITLNGFVTTSVNVGFWGCVPGGQTGASSGVHTDSVTMYLYQGTTNSLLDTGTFPVAINVTASCRISTAPGNIVFNYTSFGAAVNASTTFGATCTNSLPYTMALDSTSGTLLGLNYMLSLSNSSAGGTGVAQTYTISGSMAGGQAGICSTGTCTATQSHTLTISY